jgi:type II secretory pathway pseudopilin PulG
MELMIVVSIILAVLLIIFIGYKKTANNKKRQKEGLVYIQAIKEIITMVQQHRGLSSALLNGDNSAQRKLFALRQKVADQKKQLSVPLFINNERWCAFTDHWQRLTQQNKNTSVANSFEQHTMMIRNLAYLLEDTAELSHLTADFVPQLTQIGYVWRELVLATESIGQSRALGTGVAAKKLCSNVDKIRLNFLIKTMKNTTENTLQHLSYLPQEQQTHQSLVAKATTNIAQLIQVIEEELIQAEKVTVDNQNYFSLATKTIEKMNDIFEHQVKQLHTSL